MDKASLRPLVLEILRKTPQTHLHAIETEIRRRRTDDYERHDALALQEILWELLVQGVLAPGKNSLNLNLPFVHVTEFGAECLEDGSVLAHDPDGYAAHLVACCGEGSPDLVETTREALLAFLAGRYPSSTVMLGRSAGVLLDRLADALIRHGQRTGRGVQRVEAARTDPDRLGATLLRALASRNLPPSLVDEVEPQLRGVQALIDASRSADGRPRLPRADRDTVHARLLLFPGQCRFVHDLIGHLEGESSA